MKIEDLTATVLHIYNYKGYIERKQGGWLRGVGERKKEK
jgi:hypothetical protein